MELGHQRFARATGVGGHISDPLLSQHRMKTGQTKRDHPNGLVQKERDEERKKYLHLTLALGRPRTRPPTSSSSISEIGPEIFDCRLETFTQGDRWCPG